MMPDLHSGELRFWHGIRLFNEHDFFAAHEVLEDEWRAAANHDRAFLQGLIQIAVAMHHYSRGNLVGAASLLARGERNLSRYAGCHRELDIAKLRRDIAQWREALVHNKQTPPWPQLARTEC